MINFNGDGLPVEVAKVFKYRELYRQPNSFIEGRSLSIQTGYLVATRVHSLLQTASLIFQGGDFCFVGPSEDKSCSVIQAIAVNRRARRCVRSTHSATRA